MRFLLGLILLLMVPLPAVAAEPIDSTAALTLAHKFTPYVSTNMPGPLWTAFDDNMRTAMGDSIRWAAALDGIHAQVGQIVDTMSEELGQERGMWVYRASCRFENIDDPLTLLIALTPEGRLSGLAVRPHRTAFASTKLDYVTKTVLQLPFDGEWYVFWGGRTLDENYHAVSKSQRFACDILMVRNDASHSGDGTSLTDYYCYGKEVLAPAAGEIVWSCDSLPDQEPGKMDALRPVGNGVVIDHGNGEFSVLAHMQPKSLRVKTGDHVKTGDVLGLCGNSGNTTEPHIHYHLQDGPDLKTAEGLPAAFTALCVDGKRVDRAELVKGQLIRRCP